MLAKDYLKWYLRSPLGIGSLFAGFFTAMGGAGAGLSPLPAALAGLALFALAGGAALLSGWGPRQALAARDAGIARARLGKLETAEKARQNLARMRIADAAATEAVQLVVLAAGEYLEACRRELSDDPVADAALDDAVGIVDIFLKEMDEAATEKRFGLKDSDPFVDARDRVIAALREKAALLRERRIQIDGGLSASGRMSVREEIE